jgi:hypothetical protein
MYVEDFEADGAVVNGFLLRGRKYPANSKMLMRSGFELDQTAIERTLEMFAKGGAFHSSVLDTQRRGEGRALHDLRV